MQQKYDTTMPEKDDDILKNFGPYKDEQSLLEEQDIKKDHKDLISKYSNTGDYIRNSLLENTF